MVKNATGPVEAVEPAPKSEAPPLTKLPAAEWEAPVLTKLPAANAEATAHGSDSDNGVYS